MSSCGKSSTLGNYKDFEQKSYLQQCQLEKHLQNITNLTFTAFPRLTNAILIRIEALFCIHIYFCFQKSQWTFSVSILTEFTWNNLLTCKKLLSTECPITTELPITRWAVCLLSVEALSMIAPSFAKSKVTRDCHWHCLHLYFRFERVPQN